jgi:hypothetical protein
MSARAARVGDVVTTNFNGRTTVHRIKARCDDGAHGASQSGIVFQLAPPVPKSGGPDAWLDADWFEPAAPTTDQGRLF